MVRWGHVIPASEAIAFPNERCIEIPLGYEVLDLASPGWVLDAGCGMNRHLSPGGEARVIHLTQNVQSEKAQLFKGRRSYLCADLRDLRLFADRAFDRTACISTLEHIGFDNRTYGGETEFDPDSARLAANEMFRVTARAVIFSVPYCAEPYACDQWRFFTPNDLATLTDIANDGGFSVEIRYYGKTDAGAWFGGDLTPVEASTKDFPGTVNAIAAVRCVRE